MSHNNYYIERRPCHWLTVSTRFQRSSLAAGLAAKGFERDDKLAIVGDNRPHLYWAMAAAQSLGGIPVPMHQDAVADRMTLLCEVFERADDALNDAVQGSLREVFKLRGEVQFVSIRSLENDGTVIEDWRSYQ